MKYSQLSFLLIFLISFETIKSLNSQAESSLSLTSENIMDLFNAFFSPNASKSETKQVKKKEKILKKKSKTKTDKSRKKPKEKRNKKLSKKRKNFDPNKIFKEGWLMISSKAFRNLNRYPQLKVPEERRSHRILINEQYFRVNDRFKYG